MNDKAGPHIVQGAMRRVGRRSGTDSAEARHAHAALMLVELREVSKF